MSKCTHDLTQREVACADGMCPLCLAADLAAAKRHLHNANVASDAQQVAINRLIDDLRTANTDLAAAKRSFELIIHATSPAHDDNGHHEAAYMLAVQALATLGAKP